MPFCQYCGKELPEDAAFCQGCGKATNYVSAPTSTSSSKMDKVVTQTGMDSPLLQTKDIVMKKKILSLAEHYDFEDRSGTKLGEGDGNFFQFPAKFSVLGANGEELMRLEGKVLSIRNQFTMYDNTGSQLGVVKKKILKIFGEEYWIEQNEVEYMRIYGNFTEHDYRMEINKQQVAMVHKNWFSIRDQFGISITGEVDPRIVIGSVIVVEHVEVTERGHRGGGFQIRI